MNIQKAVIVILVIFISGCIGGTQNTPDDFGMGLVGADKGIIFEMSDLPPAIGANQAFNLEISATNGGSYSVNPGAVLVSLSSFKSFNFNLNEDFYQKKVVGRENSLTNNNILLKAFDADVVGATSLFLFENMSYKTTSANDIQVPLTIDTCYYYSSLASVNVCVAKDTSSEICSSSEAKQVVNQGAPVKVTGVEQIGSILTGSADTGQGKITSNIRIDVSTNGAGKFESYSTGDDSNLLFCTYPSDGVRLNTVRLRSIKVGSQLKITGKEITNICGSDLINIDTEGKGSINCN
ncbi:MAG: hypothetical protein CXT77_04280, partial [uncultured DHVE6 group euryarchaeote]